MSENEYGRSDSFTDNRNPRSDDTGRENNRHRTTKNRNKNGNDVTYSDRLIKARERGLPKVGLYEPIDTSRLKTRPIQRVWEKVGPNGRIGSGLRRSRPYQGPTNANRLLARPHDYEGRDPYQLTYLNHSGFIHSVREKRRPNSAPPSRADGPRQQQQPSRSPTPPPHAQTPMQPAPVRDDHGTFTREDPRVRKDPYEYPKARENAPTKIPTKQAPKQRYAVPKRAPVKPKAVPTPRSKGPTPRSKEAPTTPTSNQQRYAPEEIDRQRWTAPSPVIPIRSNPFHATNPHQAGTPDPYHPPPPQEVIPDPFPFATDPQLQNNHQLPFTPPPVSTPHITPRYDDDPLDFAPNPIYASPSREPSPSPPSRSPADPVTPPQSKYVTPKQPKITPSIQPKTTTPAMQRKSAPKPRTPRVPPETIAPPTARPTPKPKQNIPKKFPPKKPLQLPRSSLPSRTQQRTPPEVTPHPIYAPPSRQSVSFKPTTPPYSPPPPPAPQTPPTAKRSSPRREPRKEFTPSPPPPPSPPPLTPESRIPLARLQPPERAPNRRAPSPTIYAPPSRTPRPRSRHDLPEIRTPPRSRQPPPPSDDYDEFPDYGLKGPPSPGGYLPTVFQQQQQQRNPEPQSSHPLRKTYYPPTLGLEKERLHSMGTIMRSMAMYRHRGGAGTWSFRT